MLVAMAGLPGSGKSALGRALAGKLAGIILDKDSIRAALFPPEEIDYSVEQDDLCLSLMLRVAGYLQSKSAARLIILDGRPFSRRYQRADVTAYAEANGIAVRFVECVCSDQTAKRRIAQDRSDDRHVARNRDFNLYLRLKAGFEPLQEPRLVVDTDKSFEECLAQCIAYLHSSGIELAAEGSQNAAGD